VSDAGIILTIALITVCVILMGGAKPVMIAPCGSIHRTQTAGLSALFSGHRLRGALKPRAGWATDAHGPLECYRDFRPEVHARDKPTVSPSGRSFATSTRATGARLKLCQAQAVGRFPAESCSLPILSFPLQPLRPHNARAHARAEHIQVLIARRLARGGPLSAGQGSARPIGRRGHQKMPSIREFRAANSAGRTARGPETIDPR
jgi:hypothetical protein